ncbi:hypothetical protein [Rhodobacteraceae bacterium DSL-40]|uniref:hypothetical protein n=1 Tax=Amaricoccus sp. B4 TaxID=3368557 RepID=UPI000DAC907F
MATENPLNAFFAKLPEGFPIDKDATAGAWKSWAKLNERLADLAIDTMSRTNEITANSTQESLSRLRDLAKVQEEPAEYSNVLTNYVQGQFTLTRDTAEALGKVFGDARDQATELFSQAGEKAEETAEANTKAAARKTTAKAKQATAKAESAAEEAVEASA